VTSETSELGEEVEITGGGIAAEMKAAATKVHQILEGR